MSLNSLEMRDQMRARRRARYYGTRYQYGVPNDGLVEIGVVQGLGGIWIAGYIAGSGAARRIKSRYLPPSSDPAALQVELNTWARMKKLKEAA